MYVLKLNIQENYYVNNLSPQKSPCYEMFLISVEILENSISGISVKL